MQMYKYLLFDADHTLLDFNRDMEIAFRRMYSGAGLDRQLPFSRAVLETYSRCNNRWWRRFEQGLCTKPELYRSRFIDFFAETGIEGADPDQLHTLYFDALGETGSVFNGALELLAALSKHFEIYIVTNGNAVSQRTRLQNSGLMKYVRDYFISETAGAAKPDKRYFDYVLSHLPGAVPADCIVIGDSLTSDMLGAVNARMDSIWYNPGHAENPEHLPITYEAANYADILRILTAGEA